METELKGLTDQALNDYLATSVSSGCPQKQQTDITETKDDDIMELRLSHKVSPEFLRSSPYVNESKVKVVCIKRSSEVPRYESTHIDPKNYVTGLPRETKFVREVDPLRKGQQKQRSLQRSNKKATQEEGSSLAPSEGKRAASTYPRKGAGPGQARA